MTKSVGVHEAKTHLSRLLADVAAGQEVLIIRAVSCFSIPACPTGSGRLAWWGWRSIRQYPIETLLVGSAH